MEKLIIEVDENGFTIWVNDKMKKLDGTEIESRHWVVDGSNVCNNGIIELGVKGVGNYPTEASYNRKERCVVIKTKKHGKKKYTRQFLPWS